MEECTALVPWAVYNTETRVFWPAVTKGKLKKNVGLWAPEKKGIHFERTGGWRRKKWRSYERDFRVDFKREDEFGMDFKREKRKLSGWGRSKGTNMGASIHAQQGKILIYNHQMYLTCAVPGNISGSKRNTLQRQKMASKVDFILSWLWSKESLLWVRNMIIFKNIYMIN